MVTELATGLGMLGRDDTEALIAERPAVFANLTTEDWDRLEGLWLGGAFTAEFEAGLGNGRAFLESPEALAGRIPRIIEWVGARNAPGDEVVPADLRVEIIPLTTKEFIGPTVTPDDVNTSTATHYVSTLTAIQNVITCRHEEHPGRGHQRSCLRPNHRK